MAVVPMPDAPSVSASVPNVQGQELHRATPGLLEGKVVQGFNEAASGLSQAIEDAYIQGSEIRAKNAYNNIQDQINELNTRALSETGDQVVNRSDKRSFADYYQSEMKKIVQANKKGLDNYQAALVDDMSQRYLSDKSVQLINHQIRQTDVVSRKVSEALLAKSADSIAIRPWDSESVRIAKEDIKKQATSAYKGYPQEWIDRKVYETFSASIAQGISISIDQGNTAQAKALFARYKKDMTGTERDKVDAMVKAAVQKDDIRTESANIIAKGLHWSDSLREVDTIQDKDVRDGVRTEVNKWFYQRKQIVDQENAFNLRKAFDLLNKGEEIPVTLQENIRGRDPEGWNRLSKALKEPNINPLYSNIEKYQYLSNLLKTDPERAAETNIFSYAGYLSKSDMNDLLNRQKNLGKNDLEGYLKLVHAKGKAMKWTPEQLCDLERAATKQWTMASSGKAGNVTDPQAKKQMLADLFTNVDTRMFNRVLGYEFINDPTLVLDKEKSLKKQADGVYRMTETVSGNSLKYPEFTSGIASAYITRNFNVPAERQTPEMVKVASYLIAGRGYPTDIVSKAYERVMKTKASNTAYKDRPITNREIDQEIQSMVFGKKANNGK